MSDNDFIRRGDALEFCEMFPYPKAAIAALPAAPVDALVKAAGEWKDARVALNTFETEDPGNTTKRWVNLLRDAERTGEAFWAALAAIREGRE